MTPMKTKFGLAVFAIVMIVGGTIGVVAIGEFWSANVWRGKVMNLSVPDGATDKDVVSHVRVEQLGFVEDINFAYREIVGRSGHSLLYSPEVSYYRVVRVQKYPSLWAFTFGRKMDRWYVHFGQDKLCQQTFPFDCNPPAEIVEIYRKAQQVKLARRLPQLGS